MLITMLGDLTAFAGLVFGYFFYWTVHEDFPPAGASGPGLAWPLLGGGLVVAAWLATVLARSANRRDRGGLFAGLLLAAAALAGGGAWALVAAVTRTGLDPTSHVYPAIVWVLALWTALHVAAGAFMQLYCLARRLAGRLDARHDIDIVNVTLYWHFTAFTAVVAVAVVAGFPLVAGGG
jgi:cytochrome c oxidase subunit I+III